MADSKSSDKGSIGLWSAVSIGVGGMVGGGIFAVLGLSVQITKSGAPLSFLLAGLIALVTAYSYTKLSVALPSQGGTVAYLDKAFGSGVWSGSLNILLWISYIIMLSLYAYAFGSYGAELFPSSWHGIAKHGLISGIIILIGGLNILSAKLIGEVEEGIVAVKICILLIFVGIGFFGIDPGRLAVSHWSAPVPLIAGGMVIFLAYEGFELIANTAGDIDAPAKNLPRAFFISTIFVVVLYVLVALVTVGNLPVPEIVKAKDYALAEAARPFLGQKGYDIITVAALLSTASAINATLYGAARLSFIIAKDGELPAFLEKKIWNKPIEGLLITAAATLAVANFFNLNSISTMGSAGFLLIFAAVNIASCRLSDDIGSKKWISITGALLCLAALGSLIWLTMRDNPVHLLLLVGMVTLSIVIEYGYRITQKREINVTRNEQL
ncbi:MAG: APC family permease [Desulforhopalus sp.]